MHDQLIENTLHPMSDETAAVLNRFFEEVPLTSGESPVAALQKLRRALVESKEGPDRWLREIEAIDHWLRKYE